MRQIGGIGPSTGDENDFDKQGENMARDTRCPANPAKTFCKPLPAVDGQTPDDVATGGGLWGAVNHGI